MRQTHIDPLFNPSPGKSVIPSKPVTVTASANTIPLSPISNQPMIKAEGAFQGQSFEMWIDPQNRVAIPVKE